MEIIIVPLLLSVALVTIRGEEDNGDDTKEDRSEQSRGNRDITTDSGWGKVNSKGDDNNREE